MEFQKKINTGINEKYIDDEGVLVIKVLEGAHITLQSLQEDAKVNTELSAGKKVLALFDSRVFFTIEPEAREFLKSGIIDPGRIATAVLTNGLATSILVNFFIRFNKPKTPMKLFTDEQSARKWLRSHQPEVY